MAKNQFDKNSIRNIIPNALEENKGLLDEFKAEQNLYEIQPTLVQRYLDTQAQKIIDAIRKNQMQTSFTRLIKWWSMIKQGNKKYSFWSTRTRNRKRD